MAVGKRRHYENANDEENQEKIEVFDDFNAELIDRTKWANTEAVRRIENGKFVSAVTLRRSAL